MWRDEATLLDIAQAARRIVSFVRGNEFRSSHPEIAWAKIAGMRNRFIHGYDTIRWDLVWRTATEAVPQLLEQIEPLLPTEEP
jgi:uncharacterized protein with HEPN domain